MSRSRFAMKIAHPPVNFKSTDKGVHVLRLLNIAEATGTEDEIIDKEEEFTAGEKAVAEETTGLDETSERVLEAEKLKKARYPFKVILKLYNRLISKAGVGQGIPLSLIDASKGDITKLKEGNVDFYKIVQTVQRDHSVIVKAMNDNNPSDYFTFFDKYVKVLEKNKKAFGSAYKKKGNSLTRSVYITSVLYMMEMTFILSSVTVHMMNKTAKEFDKLLEETDDYKRIFDFAAELWFPEDKEMNIENLLRKDISIAESSFTDEDFINRIEIMEGSNFEEEILEGIFQRSRNDKEVGISHIAKLMSFGLSVALYKFFALARYIIYVYNFKKQSFIQRVELVNKSIEAGKVASQRDDEKVGTDKETTEKSMNYRVDTIEASNKALVEITAKDGDTIKF